MDGLLLDQLFQKAAGKPLPSGVDSVHVTELERFAKLIVEECLSSINPNTGDKHFKDQTAEEFWKNQSVYLIKNHFGMV